MKQLLVILSLICCLNAQSQVSPYYGSFTVGGNSSNFYPVLFYVSGVDGLSSLGKLSVYIDNVHANGSWTGSFHSEIEFISSNWGNINTKIVGVTYVPGCGSPYNDPIGDLADGSTASSGSQLVMWLKGGATYQWSTTLNSRINLTDANADGSAKTSASGNTLNIISSQSQLVLNAKNTRFTQSVGLGTAGNGYFGGNVGIGTISPAAPLHIIGGVGNTLLLEKTGTNVPALTWKGANYNSIIEGGDNFNFSINNQSRLYITSDGNVGVGLTQPENAERWAKVLQVYGNTDSKIMATSSNVSVGLYAHNYGFYNAPAGGIIGTTTNHPFSVMTNKINRMTVLETGNVLIGKTTQSNTSYKLDVAGNIRANKLVVNTSGADYVFNKNYKLKPLSEIEAYVKKNKHLPGIESANQMQEKGLSVGDNQTKLLEKIEELTLYLIQQNKKIAELSTENVIIKKMLKIRKNEK